jgi:hypothetical protein
LFTKRQKPIVWSSQVIFDHFPEITMFEVVEMTKMAKHGEKKY